MKRLGISAVLAAALVGAGAPGGEGDAAKKALARLQGTWKILKFMKGGDLEPADEVQKMRVVIAGDKLTVRTGKKDDEARIALDPSKKPPTIDIHPPREKKPVRGIYKLEKDQLTICFTPDGKEQRPTEFTSTQKAGTSLLVLEREKK